MHAYNIRADNINSLCLHSGDIFSQFYQLARFTLSVSYIVDLIRESNVLSDRY